MLLPKKGLLLLAALALNACSADKSQVLQLDNWKYETGFQKNILSETAPFRGKSVHLPKNLNQLPELKGYTGWLTLRHELPPEALALLEGGVPLALNGGRALDVSYYYFNERLIGRRGSAEPYQGGAMRPFLETLPTNALRKEGKNYLTIALYSDGRYPLQFMDPIELGPAGETYGIQFKRELLNVSLLMILFSVTVYHLLLYFHRRSEIYNLYYGLFALNVALYWFTANTATRDLVFGEHVELHRKLEHALAFCLPATFGLFVQLYFEKRMNFPCRIHVFGSLLLIPIMLPGPLWLMRACRVVWWGILFTGTIYTFYYLYRRILEKKVAAYYMAGGIILFQIAIVNDILISAGYLESMPISGYAFLLVVAGIAGMMASRFVSLANRVEELNEHLEEKVEARTTALRRALGRVQDLKRRQDGDYFLTSLLIFPLAVFKNKAETVKVESLVRQKKKFSYQKRRGEIGGDINIVDEIQLRDGAFSVFANADAMGKSIQGAGGALVLGTVFRSLISRTRAEDSDLRSLYPEAWLEKTYDELQTVFESFEGSMLVSAVIGLVDHFNGMFYYVNAEHPWMLLLRTGRVSFLSPSLNAHKLGSIRPDAGILVKTFRMQPDDMIVCGSDGRDDLIMVDELGSRSINNDENRFLRITKENKGNLPMMEAALRRDGELSDDLSLLSINYRPKEQNAKVSPPESLENFLVGIRSGVQEQNYGEGLKLCEMAQRYYPESLELLEEQFNLLILRKDYPEALNVALRMDRRNPEDMGNLSRLIEIYSALGWRKQAEKIMERVRVLTPEKSLLEGLEAVLKSMPYLS